MSRDLVIRIRAESGNAAAEVRRVAGELSRLEQNTARAAAAAQSATASLSRMGHAASAILATNVSVSGLVRAADAWNSLNAQLKIATGSAQEGAAAYKEVVRIATGAGQSLEQVGSVYRRFAENAGELNISQQKVAELSDTVAKAMALSGGSAASAEAALTQFGQALASGVFRGEEFNSVSEQGARLARALADGLGVSIGQLRAMAQEGKLTGDVLVTALSNARESVDKDFSQLPLTVGNAMQNLRTAWVDSVGSIEGSTGAFKGLAAGIDTVAKNMDVLIAAGVSLSAVIAGRVVAALTASAQAKIANEMASIRAAQADVRATVAAQAFAAAKLAEAQAAVAAATGMQRLAVVQAQLVPAQAALTAATLAHTAALNGTSVAATMAGRAMGLLGGPIGIAVTALTLGGAAWLAWGRDGEQSMQQVAQAAEEKIGAVIEKIQRLNLSIGTATRQQVESSIQDGYNRLTEHAQEMAKVEAALANARRTAAVTWDGDTARIQQKDREKIIALETQYQRMLTAEKSLQAELADLRDDAAKAGEDAIARFVDANAVGAAKIKAQQAALRAEYEENMKAAGGYNPANPVHAMALETLKAKLADLEKSGRSAAKAAKEAAREVERQRGVMRAWVESTVDAAVREAGSLLETTARLQTQLDTLGMGRDALARYNAEKLQGAAASKLAAAAENELAATMLAMQGKLPDVARTYRQTALAQRNAAEELQKQARLTLDISAGEAVREQQRASEEAARAAAAEWHRTADSINQSITDALLRGFEDGAGFAENFRDTVQNMFKTLVLRPVDQALVQPLAGGLASSISGMGGQGAAGGVGGTFSLLSGANSIYGALSGGLVSGVAGAIGTLGNTLGSAALGTFASGMKGAGLAAGMAGPTTAGAGGLAGAGAGFATALPWLAGGLALASVLGVFDKKPSNKAAWGAVDLASGSLSNIGAMTGDKAPDQTTLSARDAFLESAAIVGKALGAAGRVGVDIGGRDGVQLDIGTGAIQAFSTVNEALRAMYADMLADTAGTSTQFRDVIASMIEGAPDQIAGFVTVLNDNFSVLATGAARFGAAQQNLLNAFAGLGTAMPSSVDEFKALVAGLDLTTQSARDTYTGLASLAPAFLELQTELDGLYLSLMSPSEQVGKALGDLAAQYAEIGIVAPSSLSSLRSLIDAQDASADASRVLRAQLLATVPAMGEVQAALLSMAGISGDDIATTLRDAMLGRISGDDAGGQLAQSVLDGIHNAIAGNFAQSITDIMVGQVITPVIQAAVTGSSVSAAVSQAAIENMVGAANAAATALNAILSNEDFKAAMQGISTAISGTVSVSTLKNTVYKPAVTASPVVRDVEKTLVDAWADVLRKIVGTTQDAWREVEQIGWTTYERKLDEISRGAVQYQQELLDAGYHSKSGQFGEVAAWRAAQVALFNANSVAQAHEVLAGLNGEIAALSMSNIDREMRRINQQAVDYAKGLADIGQLTAANTVAVTAWADAMRASARAALLATSVTDAQSALRGAYNTEAGELEGAISKLEQFSGTVRDLRESLIRSERSPLSLMTRQDEIARQFWGVAAAANRGDADAMGRLGGLTTEYLDMARSTAASAEDYHRQFATVRNALKGVQGGTDTALDVSRSQLVALTAQVSTLIEINAGVISVRDAIAALEVATLAAKAGENSAAGMLGRDHVSAMYALYLGRTADAGGLDYWSTVMGSGKSADAVSRMFLELADAAGESLTNAARAVLGNLRDLNIPGFASGGVHRGGWRVVGERGPELELTGPARIWNAEQTTRMLGGNDAELIAEVKALRTEVAQLRAASEATARHTHGTRRQLERWDGDGMPPAREELV